MKPILIISLFLICSFSAKGQCNDQLLSMAVNQLAADYSYVKDIKVRLKKSKKKGPPISTKQSIILNKGQIYKIYTRNAKEFDGKLIFQLHNQRGNHGISFNNGRHYPKGITFKCSATGMYFLTCFYEGGNEGCSVVIVSVKPAKHEIGQYLD